MVMGVILVTMRTLLTKRQHIFCYQFAQTGNATTAYINAGYSQNEKRSILTRNAHVLMKKPLVQAKILEIQAEIANDLMVDVRTIVQEYARISFSDIKDFYKRDGSLIPFHELPDNLSHAISAVENRVDKNGKVYPSKVKLWPKVQALRSLGDHLGIFISETQSSDALIEAFTNMANKLPE